MKSKKTKKAIREMVRIGVMTEGEALAYCVAMNDVITAEEKCSKKLGKTIEVLKEPRDKEQKSSDEALQELREKYLVCTCHYSGHTVLPRMPMAIASQFYREYLEMKSQPCPMHK